MDEPIHETTDEARAGTTPHIVRYVLIISTLLAAVALTLVFLWGKAISPSGDSGNPRTEDSRAIDDQPLIEGVRETPARPENSVQQSATGNTQP